MEDYQEEIQQIREYLSHIPDGASIREIGEHLKINRNSVAKYLDILQIQGSVDSRRVGTSKIFFSSERFSVQSVKRFCSNPLLILSAELRIEYVSPKFSEMFGVPPNSAFHKSIERLPLSFLNGPEEMRILRTAVRGSEQRLAIRYQLSGHSVSDTLSLVPVVFPTGKPGVAFILGGQKSDSFTHGPAGLNESCEWVLDDQLEYVVRYSTNGIVEFANEAYCSAVGSSREDLIGRPFRPLIFHDDADTVKKHIDALSPQSPTNTIEYRAVMNSGNLEWQRWKIRLLTDHLGKPIGYQGYGMNITDLRETEKQLKKVETALEESVQGGLSELREVNRQLYQEIASRERIEIQLHHTQFVMDNAVDMVLWINKNARITYGNTSASSLLGYSAQELYNLAFHDIFPLYNLSRWDELWDQLKTEESLRCETTILVKGGERIPVEIDLRYLEYRGKEFACVFGRDISIRRRAEESLRESEERFRMLVQVAPIGIILFQYGGTIEFINPEFVRMLGYTLDDLRDLPDWPVKILPIESERKTCLDALSRTGSQSKDSAELLNITVTVLSKEGTIKMIAIKGMMLPDKRMLFICDDITEQVRIRQALVQANRNLNLLTSITRHDILNKITILMAYIQRIRRSTSDPALIQYSEKLEGAVKVIRSEIAFTRIFKNLGAEPPKWQDVTEILQSVITRHQSENVRFSLDLPDLEVYADMLLPQAFDNLISHALHIPGNVTGIRISGEERNGTRFLIFEDNGTGIPPEQADQVFEPWFGEGAPSELYVVKEILSITGFTIRSTGVCGEGTRFEIMIPPGYHRVPVKPVRND